MTVLYVDAPKLPLQILAVGVMTQRFVTVYHY